jgi:hypothetical protein
MCRIVVFNAVYLSTSLFSQLSCLIALCLSSSKLGIAAKLDGPTRKWQTEKKQSFE